MNLKNGALRTGVLAAFAALLATTTMVATPATTEASPISALAKFAKKAAPTVKNIAKAAGPDLASYVAPKAAQFGKNAWRTTNNPQAWRN